MGIISIMLKGDELVGNHTLILRKARQLKYLKLLHCYTNINSSNFKGEGHNKNVKNSERLLFASFNFLNSENYDNFKGGHSLVSLGTSAHGATSKIIVRDLYKVLLDKPIIHLQGDITLRLYFLDCDGITKPLTNGDVISVIGTDAIASPNTEMTFANIILEYEEI